MKAKIIGSITSSQDKRVGKFYKPATSDLELKHSRQAAKKPEIIDYPQPNDHQLKRSNSVGKIYSSSARKSEPKRQSQSISKGYLNGLINYDQMESKLSSYLNCTIRTNCRQKYNYLTDNYRPFSNHLYNYERGRLADLPLNDNQPLRKIANQNNYNIPTKVLSKQYNFQTSAPVCKQVKQKPITHSNKEVKRGKQNAIMPENQPKDKQNQQNFVRKQSQNMFTINHRQHKDELENKLKKIIENYETKNKELSNQLKLLQNKAETQKKTEKTQKMDCKEKESKPEINVQEEQPYKPEFLSEVYTKLVEFNFKSICLSHQCPQKESLWKSIHSQIILDERLRIIKLFINDQNSNKVLEFINASRLKKIQASALKANVEEYDPFLIQKINELFTTKQPNLISKNTARWIADNFIKCFEESERHWLKHLSQQKMQCEIKAFFFQKEITCLRKVEDLSRDLNLREFTRYLSTLFKANLRNRNVFIIYSKVKGLPYIGRFIELLEEKGGKGSDLKKPVSQK